MSERLLEDDPPPAGADPRPAGWPTGWPAVLAVDSFATLARQGLTVPEILAHLKLPPGAVAGHESALREALRQCRLEGRGEVKQAQFREAMEGRVTAQQQVLARLHGAEDHPQPHGADGDDEGEEAAAPFRIVKRILPSREAPPWDDGGDAGG